MIPTDIHKVIRYLEEHADRLQEKGRGFVLQMAARLDKYGDEFFCTWKQHKYLHFLYSMLSKAEPEKPKSNLEKLKERRMQLLKKTAKRRSREYKEDKAVSLGTGLALRNIVIENPTTAKIRHAKNRKRQLSNNRLLIKGTKRD